MINEESETGAELSIFEKSMIFQLSGVSMCTVHNCPDDGYLVEVKETSVRFENRVKFLIRHNYSV